LDEVCPVQDGCERVHIVEIGLDYLVPVVTLARLIDSGEIDLHKPRRRKLKYFLLGKILVVNVVKLWWRVPMMYLTVEAVIWFII
jgi:hypothetical protein